MPMAMEDLHILKTAETIADNTWKRVARWGPFARGAVGLQLVRAADSVGAHLAEAFGRYHFGDKLKFLYYARGSLFEFKYWLNRALARELLDAETVEAYSAELTELAKQLNDLAAATGSQRTVPAPARSVQEPEPAYLTSEAEPDTAPALLTGGSAPIPGATDAAAPPDDLPLFSHADLDHLRHST
jgi:four helix bundle protein